MKKIYSLAIFAMIAIISYAQPAANKKSERNTKIERVMTSGDLAKAAKNLSLEQMRAEKTEAAPKKNIKNQSIAVGKPSLTRFSPTAKIMAQTVSSRNCMPMAKAEYNGPHREAQVDEHGIIVAPAEGDTTYYKRSGSSYYNDGYGSSYDTQSGHVAIVECDNGEVYIKDPVCKYEQNTWVKGTKVGKTITVSTHQPIAYAETYDATLSLRWGKMDESWQMHATDEISDHFTFTVDADSITLEGTAEDLVMGVFWDDNDEATGFGDYATVWRYDAGYTPPSTELVKIPEGLKTESWYISGDKMVYGSASHFKGSLTVGLDGNDVYVKGLFEEFPDSWIKGTIKDGVATFPKLQYIGEYYSKKIWAIGLRLISDYEAVIEDFQMSYDAEEKAFKSLNDLLENASDEEPYYIAWFRDLQFMPEDPYAAPAKIPYFNEIANDDQMDEFTVIDANNDGYSWSFFNTEGARYTNNNYKPGDDWLITRAFELKAGCAYHFAFDYRASGYDERLEVKMGKEATAGAMTLPVIARTDFDNTEYKTLENDRIMVPEDGIYYFGIHAISDADKYAIYVKNVMVDEGLLPTSPAAVENLQIIPAADASNVANITFDAPSKDLSGNALAAGTALTVKVVRNNEVVKEIACTPGQKGVAYADEVPKANLYSYKIVTYINRLKGDKQNVSLWVGMDYPAEVTNAKLTDNLTSIGSSWDKISPVGKNGGIVLPDKTTYNFCTVEMYEFFGSEFPVVGEPINTEPITDTNFTYEIDTQKGVQRIEYYAVQAENATGKNDGVMLPILMGAPYELTVHDSFNGYFNYYWNYVSSSYYCSAEIGHDPSDGDAGNISISAWSGDPEIVHFESGKIALGGSSNAAICLDAKKDNLCNEIVKVFVVRPSQSEPIEVATLDLTTEYTMQKIPLTQFKDDPYIRFYIEVCFDGEGTVSIDNITISDLLDNNVSITVKAPQYVTAGMDAEVKAVVQNDGINTANGYAVKFYANEKLFAEFGADETKELATGKYAEYAATYETSVFDEAGDVVIRAEAVFDGDLKPEDNSAEATTLVVLPAASPVATLEAATTWKGVVVSWTKTEDAVAEAVEDFESYAGNTIYRDGEYCGEWKAIDVSKGENYGWADKNIKWPYTWQQFAFGIIDTNATELDVRSGLKALSGVNALAFFAECNPDTYEDQPSDRYVVSPLLPGTAQTIRFGARVFTNAYGDDTYEVLASSTDTKVESFTKVADYIQGELGWQTISADLPEGTKYFAIHYTSPCTFGLLIDDIVYLAGGVKPTGFNIYVDNKKVGSAGADATTYTYNPTAEEAAATGGHTVSVTAVYGDRESLPVTVDIETLDGIEEIQSETGEKKVFTISGVRIPADKLGKGVYIINGEKTIVK